MAHKMSNGTPTNWEARLSTESDSPTCHDSSSGTSTPSWSTRPPRTEYIPSNYSHCSPGNLNAMIPTGLAVPPNVDKESYLAGEKAALIRVFQEVLPSQQAMGALAASVHQLKEQMGEMKEVHGTVKGLQATLKSQEEQLLTLERFRIPEVESRMHKIQRDSCPKELVDVLGAIHGLHSTTLEEAAWRRKTAAERFVITASAWTRGSLSQMDVALLFMSRWLLLGKPWATQRNGGDLAASERRRVFLRAAVLICSVEVSWRGLRATERAMPWPLNRLAAWPAKPLLGAARLACWGALVVLTAHEARERWPEAVEAAAPFLRHLSVYQEGLYHKPAEQSGSEGEDAAGAEGVAGASGKTALEAADAAPEE